MGYFKQLLGSLVGLIFSPLGRFDFGQYITLIIFLMLSPHGISLAQDDNTTIYIVRFANKPQPELFDEIVEQARNKLQEYEVTVEVISDAPEKPDQYLLMSVNTTQEPDTVIVGSLASDEFELEVTPILYPNYISPNCCSSNIGVLFNTFEIHSENAKDGVANLVTALGLYQTGDFTACESIFKAALETIQPAVINGHEMGIKSYISFYRANCATMGNDFQTAITILEGEEYLTLTGKINLAWLYIQTGRSEDALTLINEMEIPYRDPDFHSRRAQLYALAYRYDDAIADLNTAIELDSDNPELYILRGQMYLYLYEWDSSLADYNRAIELDPDYADAYYYRAVLYYSILQTGVELRAEALADFQHYLELDPDGDHAADAARYIEQIETELEALNS